MTDRISAKQFRDAGGIEDWRTIFGGGWACAYFRTGSFAAGVELVRAIGEIAAAANHHPDVDLPPEGVSVKLFTSDFGGLSERDGALAPPISAAAAELGVLADPSGVPHVHVPIEAL